jgi:CHASE2 domain-containing sensor protein
MRSPAYLFGVFVSTAVLFAASPFEGALNCKRVDERTLDGTYTMDGKQVGFSHLTVSTDGKLMRVDSTATDAQGKGDQATVFLDRQ